MTTFRFAGVSRLNGELKVRFANDITRVKVLTKNGHEDIDLIELKEPMSKEDAIAYLIEIDFATKNGVFNAEVQSALTDAGAARAPKEPKAKVAKEPKAKVAKEPKAKVAKEPKVKKVKAEKPSLDKIRDRAPATTLTKDEITAQLKEIEAAASDLEDAPF